MAHEDCDSRQADWLRRQPPARNRPWALEELLFGHAEADADGAEPPILRIAVARDDESYALCRCHDFVVVDARGERGFVSDVRFLSRLDRPDELEVTFGRFRSHEMWVPVEHVRHISREREEIVLSVELPSSHAVEVTRQLLGRARHLAA